MISRAPSNQNGSMALRSTSRQLDAKLHTLENLLRRSRHHFYGDDPGAGSLCSPLTGINSPVATTALLPAARLCPAQSAPVRTARPHVPAHRQAEPSAPGGGAALAPEPLWAPPSPHSPHTENRRRGPDGSTAHPAAPWRRRSARQQRGHAGAGRAVPSEGGRPE